MTIVYHLTPRVADNALELLAERRVRLAQWSTQGLVILGAVIIGKTGDYEVHFFGDGVMCDCRAGSDHGPAEPRCSHAVAAMIAWEEHMLAAEALA